MTPESSALKAGARHSRSDMEHLKAAHMHATEAVTHMRAAGAPFEDEPAEDESPALKALDLATRAHLVCDAVCEALDEAEEGDEDEDEGRPLLVAMTEDRPHVYVYDDYAVACLDDGREVMVPYTLDGADVAVSEPEAWRLVEKEWKPVGEYAPAEEGEDAPTMKAIKAVGDVLAYPGESVKATGSGWVAGYLVRFGDPAADPGDLSQWRDIFTPATDFGTATKSDVYVHHRMLPGIGKRQLHNQAEIGIDDVGVFIKHLLDLRDPYERALYQQAERDKLGWSSGTAPHLVERKALGDGRHFVEKWPLGLDASYTPTPAGGLKMAAAALKALADVINTSDPETTPDDRESADGRKAADVERERLLLETELLLLEAA